MRKYIVSTHLGEYTTTAASAAKAMCNVRFRLFGRHPNVARYTKYWTVREAE